MKGVTLKQYIDTRGVGAVAALCRVTNATVYGWAKSKYAPNPLHAHLMIDDSMGMLSYNSIYTTYILENFELVTTHRAKNFTTDVEG